MGKLPAILIAFVDDWARQTSCFVHAKGAAPIKALFIIFLTIISMALFVYGGDNDQATLTVKTVKEQHEQRKKKFIDNYLKKKFKVPEIGTLINLSLKPKMLSRLFAQFTSAHALVLLSEDRDTKKANELFRRVCNFYLECEVGHLMDRDSFYWATETYLHLYHRFSSRGKVRPGALDAETERIFLSMTWRFMSNSKNLVPMNVLELSKEHDGYYYKGSENHWFAEVVTLWGFSEILADFPEYRNRKLPQGKTVSEMAVYLSDYLKVYLRGRAAKGFLTEVGAGRYNDIMTAMFSSIYDYAKDSRLREMAGDILDLYWAFWAQEQISGERAGGKVRQRRWLGVLPNQEPVTVNGWVYFGEGEPESYNVDYTAINNIYSSYYPSDIILQLLIERKSNAPYEIVHRRMGKSVENPPNGYNYNMRYYNTKGHLLKYSWCEKDFILGTIMRPPLTTKAWPLGSMQCWHHGLIIEGDKKAERVIPKILIEDSFNEQYAVQSKGTLITRRLDHERNKGVSMGIFISTGLKKHLQLGKDYIFIENPKVHVAVRFVQGGYTKIDLSDTNLPKTAIILAKNEDAEIKRAKVVKQLTKEVMYFENNEKYSPVIIEVAAPDMFKNFSAFKKAVLQNEAKIKDGKLEYKTIYGDKLTMFTEPNSIPLINGEKVDYHPEFVYKSPFVNSKHGSGIIDITVGSETVKLDFN